MTKTVVFSHPNLKISPRKLRILANAIKKLSPHQALARLKFTNSRSARILQDMLHNAINDATTNHHLLSDSLRFDQVRVDEGLKLKRMDKSHGSRFARGIIQKRHSRLSISLTGDLAGETK